MLTKNKISLHNNLILITIAFILTIPVIGMLIPYGFPLFTISLILIIFLSILKNQFYFKLPKNIGLFFILQMIYLSSALYTSEIYRLVIDDIKNMLLMNILLILLLIHIKNEKEFFYVVQKVYKILFIVGLIVSLIGIYKFIQLKMGIELEYFILKDDRYPKGTSLIKDYNSYALAITLVLLATYQLIPQYKNIKTIFLLNISLLLFAINIVLSGSRRGVVILIILFCLSIFMSIKNRMKIIINKQKLKSDIIQLSLFIILLLIIVFLINQKNIDLVEQSNNFDRLLKRISSISTISDTNEGSFSERIVRWNISADIINNYNIRQILVGDGFNYLTTISNIIQKNSADYPHNVLISTFLYSGIIGFLFYVTFLFHISYKYILHRKEISFFGLSFLFVSIYTFTSYNTFFSSKLYLVLIIILYSYDSVKVLKERY